MMQKSAWAALGVGLAAAFASPPQAGAQAAPGRRPTTVRLLCVGNSFSQNATHFLDDIAKERGDALVLHHAAIPGGTLEQHCDKAGAFAKDRDDPAGRYAGSGRGLEDELAAEPWDFITVQQASVRSHDVAGYRPHAARLAGIIRRGAPGARLVVHETWAYRVDDPRFDPGIEPAEGDPADAEAMYRGLAEAYRTIARELEAPIIPTGDAFHLADADPRLGFRPDPAAGTRRFEFPALPPQEHSLHVGLRWAAGDGPKRLTMDGHHASEAGQYLGALVFYESLFGRSAVGCTFRPKGVDPEYARFLQETAHGAVAALRGTEFEVTRAAAAKGR